MSQFCTMTTRERKIQAAAICREIQGPEGAEMDLGKKLSVPQDIMLEELSLTSNRGSVLFKKRQIRSDKFTFESIQNQANAVTLTHNVEMLQTENGNAGSGENDLGVVDQHPQPPPNTPLTQDTRTCESNPDCIAPGYGGPLKDVPPEKFNSAGPKCYRSPWEQAIINDPTLAETLTSHMPEPLAQPELPGYKCFNRVAIPFGGFSSSSAPPVAVKRLPLDLPAPPELHEDTVAKRPTFNRAPQGWVSSSAPLCLPTVSIDPMFIPESDDL